MALGWGPSGLDYTLPEVGRPDRGSKQAYSRKNGFNRCPRPFSVWNPTPDVEAQFALSTALFLSRSS